MDSILALALCSFGVFMGVCATAIFYVWIIRPSLLSTEFLPPNPPQMGGGGGGGSDLAAIENKLNSLLQKIESPRSPSAPPAPVIPTPDLTSLIQAVEERLAAQRKQLQQMTALLTAEISAHGQTLHAVLDQLDQQAAQLAQLKQVAPATEGVGQANSTINDLIKTQETLLTEQIERLKQLDQEIKQSSKLETEQKSLLVNLTRQVADIDGDINVIKAKKRPVRLTDIKGIGPKYAALLYEAGIENFHQLAAMNPDDLRQMLRVPKRFDVNQWIEEARLFAAEQETVEAHS
jgi:predicted flap endonuclease-1-like 5' DNA nuclease